MEQVKTSISCILSFLEDYLPLANAHATDMIVENHWETILPGAIQHQLLDLSDEELKYLPMLGGKVQKSLPSSTDNLSQSQINNTCFPYSEKTDCNDLLKNATDLECRRTATQSKSCIEESLSDLNIGDGDNEYICKYDTKESCDTNEVFSANSERSFNKSMSTSDDRCESGCSQQCVRCDSYTWRHSSVTDFCQDAWTYSIEGQGLSTSVDDLLKEFELDGSNRPPCMSAFMNRKKSYEIDIMSSVCAALARRHQCDLVLDIGSGKGYLGSQLYLQHDLSVLGVDSVTSHTHASIERSSRLQKQWDGLQNGARSLGDQLSKRERKKLNRAKRDKKVEAKDLHSFTKCSDPSHTENNGQVQGQKLTQSDTCSVCMTSELYNPADKSRINPGPFPVSDVLTDGKKKFVSATMFVQPDTNFSDILKTHFPHCCKADISVNGQSVDRVAPQDLSTDKKLQIDCDKEGQIDCDKESQIDCDKECQIDCDKECQIDCDKEHHSDVTKSVAATEPVFPRCKDTSMATILLTGLHTCGNLGSSMLQLFVRNPDIRVVCGVGCCYHLINEQFGSTSDTATIDAGFPLSVYLQERQVTLGKNARNLASQSVHRMGDFTELQGSRFFPRAVLQQMISDLSNLETKKVTGLRNLEQRSKDAHDYLMKASERLSLSQVDDKLVDWYLEHYSHWRQRLAAFFQLRATLAPCIESLILLDRVCYLLEQDCIQDVNLVKLFDPQKSPRCYGIIATKTSTKL